MVFITKKVINNKERYYIEYSFRYPNKKLKKVSIYLKNYKIKDKENIIKTYTPLLKNKEKELLIEYTLNKYKNNHIFNKKIIKELEESRLEYKKIIKSINKQQFKDILNRFTINFTYESNALEGNSLTLKDVTLILYENITIKDKDLREIYETKNTRKAMELVFQNKFKINKKDIIKLHSILIENTGISKGFKKLPNHLLMRNLETTPPEKVESKVDELIKWYNQEENLHPLEKATIFHGKFEKIHPFQDGNGRTGRMLINIMLIKNNYPPLIIRKNQRISYFSALEAFDYKHEDKLKRFMIEKYKNTFEKFFKIYIKYL
jgi:Fic family protein|tara:strand:- start:320 stop:1279 length:960 start_codon:yes stop_codon:yes gene_type:complete